LSKAEHKSQNADSYDQAVQLRCAEEKAREKVSQEDQSSYDENTENYRDQHCPARSPQAL